MHCYIELEKLGEGAHGEVFKAFHTSTAEIVAVKKLRMPLQFPENYMLLLLKREISLLQKLQPHPNIVLLKDVAVTNTSKLLMVFEYVENDLGMAWVKMGRRFSAEEVKMIMKQLLQAVQHCHRNNVLHLDIKPENILISNQNRVKLADFGLSREWNPFEKGEMREEAVSLWYRCPELLCGCATRYSPAIDMWSVGCVFAELLQGYPLFPCDSEEETLNVIVKMCYVPIQKIFNVNFVLLSELRCIFSNIAEPEAVDLLEKMLDLNPERRITAQQALDSPYFNPPSPASAFLSSPSGCESLGGYQPCIQPFQGPCHGTASGLY